MLKHVPVILFTASGSAAMTDEKVIQFAADDYIVKPFDPEEFRGKVEKILARGVNL